MINASIQKSLQNPKLLFLFNILYANKFFAYRVDRNSYRIINRLLYDYHNEMLLRVFLSHFCDMRYRYNDQKTYICDDYSSISKHAWLSKK